jgi:hypothetical protein
MHDIVMVIEAVKSSLGLRAARKSSVSDLLAAHWQA